MKARKLIASLAALCAFAITGAQAQRVTNNITINILLIPQGPTQIVDGTNTLYEPEKALSLNTAQFLQEMDLDVPALFGTNLTKNAKLVLLTGGNQAPLFGVIDGPNFYGLTNTITLMQPFETVFKSGTQNGGTRLAFPSLKTIQIEQLSYNDISLAGDGGLQFILQGLQISSTTDTEPESGTGVYSETDSVKITDLVGEIAWHKQLYFASGSMSFSGKGKLVLP